MNKFPYQAIDLTHTLDEKIPTWDGSCGFEHLVNQDYDPTAYYKFKTHKIRMNEGIGTHMDAPAHCDPKGMVIDELPLSHLIAPCIRIDVSASADERSYVTVQDIENFEKEYGVIEARSVVMIRTGWERFWDTPKQYHNNHRFPSISKEAAELLLARDILGMGIDTLSPDRPQDGFPVHRLLLEAGKYIIENAANVALLPARGSFILALPLKIKGGTEAPIRLIGLLSDESNC